jgi:hypothetical protein
VLNTVANPTANIFGAKLGMIGSETSAPSTRIIVGGQGLASVASANTQNWTNAVAARALWTIPFYTGTSNVFTVSGAAGLYIDNAVVGSAILTNQYGIYMASLTAGATNYAILTNTGHVIFNEAGSDSDFRIEGDTNANLFFVDASTDNIGIGTNAPGARLDVTKTATDLTGSIYALQSAITVSNAGSSGGNFYALRGMAYVPSNNAQDITGSLRGASGFASHNGTGTVATAYGVQFLVSNDNAGTITTAYGLHINITKAAGTIGTAYGLYIPALTAGATNYALYTAAGLNRFGDQLAIVGSADRAQLTVTGYSTQAVGTGLVGFTRADAAAGVSRMLTLTALGSGADGDGGSIVLLGKSSTTAAQAMGRIAFLWGPSGGATHASRKANVVWYASDSGGEREIMRGAGTGTAGAICFLAATAPVGVATVNAAATDLATVVALTNQLRAALIALGLCV